jgi:hypothetical protein
MNFLIQNLEIMAHVVKISDSKKTVLIAHKANVRQIGYTFGWAAACEGDEVGTIVPDFNPKGLEPVMDKDGAPVLHQDGSSVMRWVF